MSFIIKIECEILILVKNQGDCFVLGDDVCDVSGNETCHCDECDNDYDYAFLRVLVLGSGGRDRACDRDDVLDVLLLLRLRGLGSGVILITGVGVFSLFITLISLSLAFFVQLKSRRNFLKYLPASPIASFNSSLLV